MNKEKFTKEVAKGLPNDVADIMGFTEDKQNKETKIEDPIFQSVPVGYSIKAKDKATALPLIKKYLKEHIDSFTEDNIEQLPESARALYNIANRKIQDD